MQVELIQYVLTIFNLLYNENSDGIFHTPIVWKYISIEKNLHFLSKPNIFNFTDNNSLKLYKSSLSSNWERELESLFKNAIFNVL